jgi:exodeoxyribonuclease-1
MNYVFYDIETSGRSSSWDQIIEVGAVLVYDDVKVLVDKAKLVASLISVK